MRDYYFVAKRRKKPRGACRNPTKLTNQTACRMTAFILMSTCVVTAIYHFIDYFQSHLCQSLSMCFWPHGLCLLKKEKLQGKKSQRIALHWQLWERSWNRNIDACQPCRGCETCGRKPESEFGREDSEDVRVSAHCPWEVCRGERWRCCPFRPQQKAVFSGDYTNLYSQVFIFSYILIQTNSRLTPSVFLTPVSYSIGSFFWYLPLPQFCFIVYIKDTHCFCFGFRFRWPFRIFGCSSALSSLFRWFQNNYSDVVNVSGRLRVREIAYGLGKFFEYTYIKMWA